MAIPSPKPKSALGEPTNNFRANHSAAQSSGAAQTEANKRYTNSYKEPLELTSNDVPDYVDALIVACANGKQTLNGLLIMATNLVTAGGFGTHTTKFPNTNTVVSENALMAHPMPRSSVGITSSNTLSFRPYVCAGNAADIAAQRFLSASVLLDGARTTMADDLATHGPMFRYLLASTPTVNAVSAALRARMENPSILQTAHSQNKNHANHGGIPTIWQPVNKSATEFHLVSVVASVPLIAEVRTREIAGKTTGTVNVGNRQTTKVGGAQPQNAGLFAMDQAGFIRHLASFPPRFDHRHPVNLTPYFHNLKKLLNEDGCAIRNNANVRDAHRNIITKIVDEIVAELIDPPFGDAIAVTVDAIMDAVTKAAKRAKTMVYFVDIFHEVAEVAVAEEGVV